MDKFAFIGFLLVFITVLSLVLAFPFMWIWNYAVVSAIEVAKPITYWPAYWLMVFCMAFMTSNNSSSGDK